MPQMSIIFEIGTSNNFKINKVEVHVLIIGGRPQLNVVVEGCFITHCESFVILVFFLSFSGRLQ